MEVTSSVALQLNPKLTFLDVQKLLNLSAFRLRWRVGQTFNKTGAADGLSAKSESSSGPEK